MTPLRRMLLLVLALVALVALTGHPVSRLHAHYLPEAEDVQQNDLYALGQLMSALGAHTTMYREMPDALPPLPAAGATLWLMVPGRMISDARRAALLDWVRAGGRLVLAPGTPSLWRDDPLLAAIGLRLEKYDDKRLEDALGPPRRRPSTGRDGFLYAIDGEHALAAGFNMRLGIGPLPAGDDAGKDKNNRGGQSPGAGEALLCDPVGCHGFRVALGGGSVIALSEAGPFTNYALRWHDHAAIARWLVAPARGSEFWLVHGEQVPSLFTLLWQYAGFALLALLATVLLWVLAAGMRFGPLLAPASPARRRLAEHVVAAGDFLARAGNRRLLWQAAATDFHRTLHRRHPQAHGMDDEALATLVAQHTGVAPAQVQAALAPLPPNIDDAALAAAIRRLDTLRRLL